MNTSIFGIHGTSLYFLVSFDGNILYNRYMKLKLKKNKFKVGRREILGFLLGMLVVGALYEASEYIQRAQLPRTLMGYQAGGVTIPWIPDSVKRWDEQIQLNGEKYDIHPNLIAIIMTLESGGYTRADSGEARGLMQVTPYTAGDIAQKFLKEPISDYDLFDPATNIEFGTAYLAYLRNTFCVPEDNLSSNECAELMAAGYNGGPGAAGSLYRGEGLSDMETVGYSRDARNMWRERAATVSPTYDRWRERGGQSLIDAGDAE